LKIVFFADRDLGNYLPTVIKNAGIPIEKHADHFDQSAKDEDWLPKVGESGWFVLTRDKRIRYRQIEQEAVMRAGVGLFVLIGQTTHRELAENFVNSIDKVRSFIEANKRPFIAKIYRPSPSEMQKKNKSCPGKVELWLSHDEWSRG
jgi:hypothetical protein